MKEGMLLVGLGICMITQVAGQSCQVETWSEPDSPEPILLYTLTNAQGLKARVINHGATLIGLEAPDRNGKTDNLVLYLNSAADYVKGHPLLGSVVGRFANRIDSGGFTIDEVRYDLESVNPKTGVHIHGGKTGFQRKLWLGSKVSGKGFAGVKLELVSPDGHEGYPGEVTASVTYTLNNLNELHMHYEAVTTKPTHVNLTNHAYWNLSGAGSGKILHHKLQINSTRYLEVDERKIPTGQLVPAIYTPMDFTLPRRIGKRIAEVQGGYDHCYAIKHLNPGDLTFAAKVDDRRSGRIMEVWTTAPGLQLYTANGLNLTRGGVSYGPHSGVCLEAQHYPDTPNKSTFPSTLLRPGEVYRQTTVHKFSVAD